MRYKKVAIIIFSFSISAMIFQNCSKTRFQSFGVEEGYSSSTVDNNNNEIQIEQHNIVAKEEPIQLIFAKSENGSSIKSFIDSDNIFGRVIGLRYHNAEVCTEVVGKTDDICSREDSWEKLPNKNWAFENNEWRLRGKAGLFGRGNWKVTFRNLESKNKSNEANLSILSAPAVCVSNYGQECSLPYSPSYYYSSSEMSSSECFTLSNHNKRRDLGSCPQPSKGYEYSFQVCKAQSFNGLSAPKYKLYCAQHLLGAGKGRVDCSGQCVK